MKRDIYYHGEPNAKYGIWDTANKGWEFDISEDTPMLAMARLYQRIGCAAKMPCFEARRLPKNGRIWT